MVIFHSYVSVPEGNLKKMIQTHDRVKGLEPAKMVQKNNQNEDIMGIEIHNQEWWFNHHTLASSENGVYP